MFDDQSWKVLYRLYLICLFFTGAAFEAYLVYHVGYAPNTISTIMRVAIPAALISVPIVALIVMPTLLILALAKNEDEIKKLKDDGLSLLHSWNSEELKKASKKARFFARSKIFIKGFFALLGVVYVFIVFAFSAYGILLMFSVNFSFNSPWLIWVKLLLLTLLLIGIYLLAILSVYKKANVVFSLSSILFFFLVGCVEYHWMPAFLAKDGLATNGFGKVFLSAKKYYPLFENDIRCKPYYLRIGTGRYMLAYAKLMYAGKLEDIIEYTGHSYGSIARSLEEISDSMKKINKHGVPPYPKPALCLASVPVKPSIVIFHGTNNKANIEHVYVRKNFPGYKADLKYILKNMSGK